MFLLKSCSQRFGRYPRGGRPQRSLKLGFHFSYINNPGKPDLGVRRFASTERPETVPTGSCQPMVMKSKSLNYYGFAQITVPTAVPACAFSLRCDAISLFWLNCTFDDFGFGKNGKRETNREAMMQRNWHQSYIKDEDSNGIIMDNDDWVGGSDH